MLPTQKFNVGDLVIHSSDGLCEIKEISFDGIVHYYYVVRVRGGDPFWCLECYLKLKLKFHAWDEESL